MAYDTSAWHDFYVMTGGAAAALTGLLFVAMSLHAREIMANRFFSNRAVSTLMSLASQLLMSGAVLIPGQSITLLGAEIEAVAVFFLVFTIYQTITGGRNAAVASTWTNRIMEFGGGTTWILLFIFSGISLLLRAGGGLYLLAAVMFFMFAWNIYIAWILITEVSEAG